MNLFKCVYVNFCECIVFPYYRVMADMCESWDKLQETSKFINTLLYKLVILKLLYVFYIYNYSFENLFKTALLSLTYWKP